MVLKVEQTMVPMSATGILTNKTLNLSLCKKAFRKQQSGFTLIEIMVVVVVAAIMAAFIGVRANTDNDRVARLEAKRFIAVLNEVRDEALMTGRVFALQFKQIDRSYLFYSNPADWEPIAGDRLLRERTLPEGIEMEFDIETIENDEEEEPIAEETEGENGEGEPTEVASLSNYILISPVDELTPFSLTLSGDDYRYQISLNDEQKLEAKRL